MELFIHAFRWRAGTLVDLTSDILQISDPSPAKPLRKGFSDREVEDFRLHFLSFFKMQGVLGILNYLFPGHLTRIYWDHSENVSPTKLKLGA